jgi:hypothetical protein
MKLTLLGASSARATAAVVLALALTGCAADLAPAVSPGSATSPAPADPTAPPTAQPTVTGATATATPSATESPTSIDHAPGSGSWILYQAVYGGFGPVDLGLVRADGSDAQRITGGPGNRWHPDWSPDGTLIAYDHELPDESSRLGVINLADGSDEFLTECIAPCMNHQAPAWSPDGQFVGFDGWEQPEGGSENCFLARLELAIVVHRSRGWC